VCKHQQEISLAALPRIEDNSDDESVDDDEDDNDSSDNDDDDNDDNSDSKSKGKDDVGTDEKSNIIDPDYPNYLYKQLGTDMDATSFATNDGPITMSEEEQTDTPLLNEAETINRFSDPSQLQRPLRHEQNVAYDDPQPINFTWGPQNRLMSSVRDFDKTLEKCQDLWRLMGPNERFPVLASLRHEVYLLGKSSKDLTSRSSSMDQPTIDKAIETLAICRTQLLRLQHILESALSKEEGVKKSKRSNLTLRLLFTRQETLQKRDLEKAQDILNSFQIGGKTLGRINAEVQGTSSSQNTSGQLLSPPVEHLPERAGPQLTLSPTGILQVGRLKPQETPLVEKNARPKGLKPSIQDQYENYQSFLTEPMESTSESFLDLGFSVYEPDKKEMTTDVNLAHSNVRGNSSLSDERLNTDHVSLPEDLKNAWRLNTDRVSLPEDLKSAWRPENSPNDDENDDVAYPCKGCGDIVSNLSRVSQPSLYLTCSSWKKERRLNLVSSMRYHTINEFVDKL
jgi:hypothetical protein